MIVDANGNLKDCSLHLSSNTKGYQISQSLCVPAYLARCQLNVYQVLMILYWVFCNLYSYEIATFQSRDEGRDQFSGGQIKSTKNNTTVDVPVCSG